MGGMYGPAYAGKQTTERDGTHGPAICQRPADRRMRMVCPRGHAGPIMDLCGLHAQEIMDRMAACCTRCVWPDEARGVNEACDWIMTEMADARAKGDVPRYGRLEASLNDHAKQMDELLARGVIAKVPLKLVEVS
jgi:hypothetical protein